MAAKQVCKDDCSQSKNKPGRKVLTEADVPVASFYACFSLIHFYVNIFLGLDIRPQRFSLCEGFKERAI